MTSAQTPAASPAVAPAAELTVSPAATPAKSGKDKSKKARRVKSKGDDFSGDRDCNMFQVEPSVINERYYTSGKAEHHQKISPTLPYGAPIPDNEGPYQPDTKAPVKSSNDIFNDKLDSQVKASLIALKDIKSDSPSLKLKLRVSTMDDALLINLKEMKVDVISSSRASGDIIVYAPAQKVNDIGSLHQVLNVLLAQ
ncbi:MAG: hypothetical protein JSS86_06395 [Cyanobacteria bacterium SZAS LIN-2]|nr:hypothetical protein [Cyanobacteria bacterium SZAS LIN-2]